MRHRKRGISARGERRGKRRHLVGVAARRQRGKKHHQQPHRSERGGRDESQVQPRDDQHVSESGQREPLTQTLADIAAVADDQRAHLGALGAGEVGVNKGADARA